VTLSSGTKLGPYEVVSPLGAGGMGEVYRARDAKLHREVAIKVLPDSVAQDPERLARFQREAQVLAALNHPHIAAIYGLEEFGDAEALVLELVEGETLAERIAAGPLPMNEALAIARQIAEALEAAHDKGIVHRDLKPANVKLTPDGNVKVLDFGLAKALAADASAPDATRSPTITAAATRSGVIIGTAAYMSPEQARGRGVDKRTDIWAFGAVLYEMLTGRKAFDGETISDVLAAVLMADVDWEALPAQTPPAVRRVLRRCLDRDPRTRFHDIADARIAMDETPEATAAAAPAVSASPAKRSSLWPAVAAALLVVAALGWWRTLSPSAGPRLAAPTRLSIVLPAGVSLPYDDNPVFSLSRDGRKLVAVGEKEGATKLYIRFFADAEARPIEGTADVRDPFFSPDGRWIAYFQEGKLKKILVEGGSPVVLADVPNPRGGVWLDDDTIVYSPGYTAGLWRVPARGGKAEELTKLDAGKGERTHRWPAALPDGKRILFTVGSARAPSNYESAEVDVLDLATGKRTKVFEGGSMPRFVPPDRLVVVRGNTVLGATFDPSGTAVGGEAAPIIERVGGDPSGGAAYLAVSAAGTIAYAQGALAPRDRTLVIVDRKSQEAKDVPLSPRLFQSPRFSPDGARLAFSIGSGGGADDDVYILDFASNAVTRLTFNNTGLSPIWSPDGRRLAFGSVIGGKEGVWMKAADGGGQEEELDSLAGGVEYPTSWSQDGRHVSVTRSSPTVGGWMMPVGSPGEKPRELVAGGAAGSLSPDGRYFAYGTGLFAIGDVFVLPTDGSPGKWQVTPEKGGWPVWRGKEIFFLREGGDVWAVDVETVPTFRAGAPQLVFSGNGKYNVRSAPLYPFDVSADGQRFVLIRTLKTDAANRIDVVLDWPSELARVPGAGKK
jgi:serine/threonine-protein kinase